MLIDEIREYILSVNIMQLHDVETELWINQGMVINGKQKYVIQKILKRSDGENDDVMIHVNPAGFNYKVQEKL